MNVLVVSGIWPPDVGGPASHAPQVAPFLLARGHGVSVVTTASAEPERQPFPVHWISRSLPKGVVHVRTGLEVARRAARGGRRLHDRDVRPQRRGRDARAPAVRDQAHG